jgi:alpha-glucosidase
VLIGELADMDSSRLTEKYTQDEHRLHAAYDFDLINTPPEAGRLIELLRRRRRFMPTGWILNAFSNHDATRAVSNLTAFASEAGRLRKAAKMLLFLQITLRGGAIIYQGEELGLPHPELDFEDLRDPWGINLWPDFEGRDASRTPMPWQAQGEGAGFTDGGKPWLNVADEHRALAVAEQEDDPNSVLTFFRTLVAWRRNEPVLLRGDEEVHGDDRSRLIVYDRFDETRRLRMAVNFSTDRRFFPVDPAFIPVGPPGAVVDRTEHGVELPPLGFVALAVDDPG